MSEREAFEAGYNAYLAGTAYPGDTVFATRELRAAWYDGFIEAEAQRYGANKLWEEEASWDSQGQSGSRPSYD